MNLLELSNNGVKNLLAIFCSQIPYIARSSKVGHSPDIIPKRINKSSYISKYLSVR